MNMGSAARHHAEVMRRQGLISRRAIESACATNVQFIAISGDNRPSHAHIAKFVSSLGGQIKPLFSQVLMTCDAQGLIGRDMFAIDGVKLPSNASKERSGTHEELRHRAERQVIVAADVIGSGSEQTMLLALIEQSEPLRAEHTLITADAGYHSDANIRALMERGTAALIADNQMRRRDARFGEHAKHKAKDDPLYDKQSIQDGQVRPIKLFRPADFKFNGDNTCTCPAGKQLISTGAIYTVGKGLRREDFKAKAQDCASCVLREQCLRHPERTPARNVAFYQHSIVHNIEKLANSGWMS